MLCKEKMRQIYKLCGKLNLYINTCEDLNKRRIDRELNRLKEAICDFEKYVKDLSEKEKNFPEEISFISLQEKE